MMKISAPSATARKTLALCLVCAALLFAPAARADRAISKADVIRQLWEQYCAQFLDLNANNKWTTCPQATPAPGTPGKTVNGDIDVEGILFRDTLNLEDKDTYIAVQALIRNLIQPNVNEKLPETLLNDPSARQKILLDQHVQAARKIAADTVSHLFSTRQSIPAAPAELTAAATTGTQAPASAPPASGAGGTPVPPPSAGATPAPAPGAPPATPIVGGANAFDWALGDSISNGVQNSGKLAGGSCPDNNRASCPCPSAPGKTCQFFNCDPAANSTGATCVGRPASNILNSVIPHYASSLSGKNVVFSSGLSNQPSACNSGGCAACTPGDPTCYCASADSTVLRDQLTALKAAGVARIVVLGTSYARADLAILNSCVRNVVTSMADPSIGYIDGFTNSSDKIHPSNYNAYLDQAQTRLATLSGTPTSNPATSTCPDGTPKPCATPATADAAAAANDPAAPPAPGLDSSAACPYYDAIQNAQGGSFEALMIKIGGHEGGGKYKIRSPSNYLGKYQFYEGALQMCVKNDNNAPGSSCGAKCNQNNNFGGDFNGAKSFSAAVGSWDKEVWQDNSCTISADLGPVTVTIRNSEDFLNNPCIQEARMRTAVLGYRDVLNDSNVARIMCQKVAGKYTIEKWCPKCITGSTDPNPSKRKMKMGDVLPDSAMITPSGIMYGAHMLGTGGIKKAVSVFLNGGAPATLMQTFTLNGDGTTVTKEPESTWKSKSYPAGWLMTDANDTNWLSRVRVANGYAVPGVATSPTCDGGVAAGSVSFPKPGDGSNPDPEQNLEPPKPVAEVVKEIRTKAGVDPAKIAENPSYNEIMQAMTKEKFFDPTYFAGIADDLGAIQQEQVMVDNYTNILLMDIYGMHERINALLVARASLKFNKANRPTRATSTPLGGTP